MKKLLFLLIFIFSFSFMTNASSIEDNTISYELNEYDIENVGAEDTFEPYTEEEIRKNKFEISFINFKLFLLKNKVVSFLLILIVVGIIAIKKIFKIYKHKE